MTRSQKGFGAVEAILILIVIGLIGTLGYVAYTNFIAPPATDNSTVEKPSPSDITTGEAPTGPVTIESDNDLQSVDKELDTTGLEDTDATSLDTDTADL